MKIIKGDIRSSYKIHLKFVTLYNFFDISEKLSKTLKKCTKFIWILKEERIHFKQKNNKLYNYL